MTFPYESSHIEGQLHDHTVDDFTMCMNDTIQPFMIPSDFFYPLESKELGYLVSDAAHLFSYSNALFGKELLCRSI